MQRSLLLTVGNNIVRRMTISQNCHEIFIIVSEYSESYIKYVTGQSGPPPDGDFLVMKRFGPWDVTRKRHRREIGMFCLAASLQEGRSVQGS